MTLSAMQTKLTRALSLGLDHEAGETPSPTELTDSINQAIRFVSLEIYQLHPLIPFTPTASSLTQDMRDPLIVTRKVIEPLIVRKGTTVFVTASGRKYGLWTLTEFNQFRSNWPNDDAGTTTAAAFHDRTLYLHPKPDTAAAAETWYIGGRYMAADMVAGEDDDNEPDIPEELHEDVVRLAAVFAADATVSESEALARLGRYEGRAKENMAKVRSRNMRLAQSWGTISGSRVPDFIQV